MGNFAITGGNRLRGEVEVQTSKNAVLPLMAAAVLTGEPVRLRRCPAIADVRNMGEILTGLGCEVSREGEDLIIDAGPADRCEMPTGPAKELRSSIFLLGPMLGRFGRAVVAYPGGCDIGLRPIDLHLKGLACLGAEISEQGGAIVCDGRKMRGGLVHLDFPSVGATENIMMAAVRAKGRTRILNAAKEPEIADLQAMLNRMGARVYGAGCSTVEIEGVEELHGVEFRPIPDRIAAGTLMIACAMCGGEILLKNVIPEHLSSLIFKLRESACKITLFDDKIRIAADGRPRNVHKVETSPYPGFPTDLQAQYLALLTVGEGTGMILETIFETRFKHAAELIRMGADITVRDRIAMVRGVERLHGAEVRAHDLRGGAALVLAGLAAEGETVVRDIGHIDRGYERLEDTLSALGGNIRRS